LTAPVDIAAIRAAICHECLFLHIIDFPAEAVMSLSVELPAP